MIGVALTAGLLFFASPAAGEPAPALLVKQLDGKPFDLQAQKGKVVVVNFWATWCGPCRAEMPALDAFYKAHQGEGLVLLGLSMDGKHDRGEVEKVMAAFSYPAAMEEAADKDGLGRPAALPTSWVIDRGGVVRAKLIGQAVDAKKLNELLLPLLKP